MKPIRRLRHGSLLAFPVAVFLGGCASTNPPDPIVVIPDFNTNNAANKNIDQNSNPSNTSKNNYQIKDPDLQKFTPLPVETDINAIEDQLRLYSATWYRQSALYTDYGNNLSNFQFASALLGGISALTKSPQGATIGVGAAGATGLISSHYQLTVQSTNYSKGADAMQCLLHEISAIPNSVWSNAYSPTTGEFYFTRSEMQNAVDAQADLTQAQKTAAMSGYDTLTSMIAEIRQNIDSIVANVRNAQQSVIIAAPSSADIQNAISNGVKASGAAATNTTPAAATLKAAAATKKTPLVADQKTQSAQLDLINAQKGNVAAKIKANTASLNSLTLRMNSAALQPQSETLSTTDSTARANFIANQQTEFDTEQKRLTSQSADLNSQVSQLSDNITLIKAAAAATQGQLDKLAELTYDEINRLLLLPAAMINCTTTTGSATTGNKSGTSTTTATTASTSTTTTTTTTTTHARPGH